MRVPRSYLNYMYLDLLTAPSIQYERLIDIFWENMGKMFKYTCKKNNEEKLHFII